MDKKNKNKRNSYCNLITVPTMVLIFIFLLAIIFFISFSFNKSIGTNDTNISGVYFNGNSYIPINNTVNGNFTAVMWVKYINANSLGVILSSGVGNNEHSKWYVGDGGEIINKTACGIFSNQKIGNYTAGWSFAEINQLKPNIWYQITCRYNGSYISLYINGSIVNSTRTKYPPIKSNILEIGKRTSIFYLNGNMPIYAYFNGYISNIQVYNASLSIADIQKLYFNRINGPPFQNVNIYLPLTNLSRENSGIIYYVNGNIHKTNII
jgi:hypothetical protein